MEWRAGSRTITASAALLAEDRLTAGRDETVCEGTVELTFPGVSGGTGVVAGVPEAAPRGWDAEPPGRGAEVAAVGADGEFPPPVQPATPDRTSAMTTRTNR